MAVRYLDGLGAVEPERSGDCDFKVDELNTCVIGWVELIEARVEAALEGRAWLSKRGLSDGVVGAVEVEVKDISDGGVDLVVLVEKLALGTNNDSMNSARCSRSMSCFSGGVGGSLRRRKDGCGRDLSVAFCGGDSCRLTIDDRYANIDYNNGNSGLLIDSHNAVFARRITSACRPSPDGGLGLSIVHGCDYSSARSNVRRWNVNVSLIRSSNCDGRVDGRRCADRCYVRCRCYTKKPAKSNGTEELHNESLIERTCQRI